MKRSLIACSAITLLLQACAFTTAHLDVQPRPESNYKGPMSDLPATTFEIKPFEDAREDQKRIGYKVNGFGQHTADILTTHPVTDIVVDAVRMGLEKNGQTVGIPSDVVISGKVTRFWFDFKPNFWTIEFTGNVEADMEFTSAKTGESIFKARYSGTYTKKTGGGLDGTWTEVMDSAVEKLVEDVVYDSDLIDALKASRQ